MRTSRGYDRPVLPLESTSTELDQRMFVSCPANAALIYLSDFVRARRSACDDGKLGYAQLALRPPVMLSVIEAEIVLQRDVVVEIAPAENAEDGETFGVTWAPAGGGPFPRFRGSLRVERDDARSCCLVLQGSCGPAAAGGSRDSEQALGHRITVSAARMFLRELRTELETFSRFEERTI